MAGTGGWFGVALLVLGGPLGALAQVLPPRPVTASEAPRWSGVGSLRVAGRPTCTAVLISDHEAITAAHCVVDIKTGLRIPPALFGLLLGQTDDGVAAMRGVRAIAVLPGFLDDTASMASDLALLDLDSPVPGSQSRPVALADWTHPVGGFVDVVGYERDGPTGATIREGCMALQAGQGVITLRCDVVGGLSGAPVLLSEDPDAPPRLVAVVSSRGPGLAFVVAIAPQLAALRRLIK